MRTLRVATLQTLDGVIQDPGGFGEIDAGGWAGPYFSEQARQFSLKHALDSDTFLMGRKTFEQLFKAWGNNTDGEYAQAIQRLNKVVVSTTLNQPLDWDAKAIRGDVAGEVARLKEQPGKAILLYGSAGLMRTLMDHDLVDEYVFWIVPVVIGRGTRLFAEGQTAKLRLVDATMLDTGAVILTYRR